MDQLIYIIDTTILVLIYSLYCYFVTYDTTFDFVTLWQYLRNLLEDTKLFIPRNFENGTYDFFLKIRSLVQCKTSTKFRTFGHLRSS